MDLTHCVDEWGDEDFRPDYRKLDTLRNFTGQEVPFVACTATASTSTFDVIWKTLGFGYRPFWGIDVGSDRPNLLFLTRTLINTKNPVLDALHVLPKIMNADTAREAIDKCLFYFDSEAACRLAVQTLRKCLPAHLRDCVHAFSSDLSEAGKQKCWDGFASGRIRIVCATDAAGMGCNVPDVRYSIIFGCPKSLAVVAQRWGRAGRDRLTEAVCILLVPSWAFRPAPPSLGLAVQQVRGKRKIALESKASTKKRANLDTRLEEFINLSAASPRGCAHKYLAHAFRPSTRLSTFDSLSANQAVSLGSRSLQSSLELSWIVLDLPNRSAPASRCCNHCDATLLGPFSPASNNDPRLYTFSADFIHPLTQPPSRPPSRASNASNESHASSAASAASSISVTEPLKGVHVIPNDVKERLREALVAWRDRYYKDTGASIFLSSSFILPSKVLETLVTVCVKFLNEPVIDARTIRNMVQWDLATDTSLTSVAAVITEWSDYARTFATPKSQHRRKKARDDDSTPRARIPQPVFESSPVRSVPSSSGSNTLHTPLPTRQPPQLLPHVPTQLRNVTPASPAHFRMPQSPYGYPSNVPSAPSVHFQMPPSPYGYPPTAYPYAFPHVPSTA
ncbi:hypothetical protein PLICRDRAFT_170449 [Plicaturopsis crispa FD-325 SS-3]|nr:hypothetical protein PLICRDRAFT_170449 [Plicaturopsis crispa FD-325 SS-3]